MSKSQAPSVCALRPSSLQPEPVWIHHALAILKAARIALFFQERVDSGLGDGLVDL